MATVFLKLLNMSITASWVVLAVVLLRLLLKKAPTWINCLLWSVVALRLVMPFSPESAVSLIPSAEPIPQTITEFRLPADTSGLPAVTESIDTTATGAVTQEVAVNPSPVQTLFLAASIIWIVGMGAMLAYGIFSYLRLYRKVRPSLLFRENIFYCDSVDSPFILGIIRPRIYLPSGMPEAQLQYVIAHEKAHLRRRDHCWKPVGFVLLTVHWFNPFMWLAYGLLCRDIEKACDEKVIKGMDNSEKRGYSEALVSCSVRRRMIMVCPIAFGEVGVKDRIRSVLNYKKPAFWIIIVAIAACAVAAVCFLTNPFCEHTYESRITLEASCAQEGVETFTCKLCEDSYTQPVSALPHTYGEGQVLQTATCTQAGSAEHTCTDCGAVEVRPLQTVAHTFGNAVVLKEPNCVQPGQHRVTCTVCGAVEEQPIGTNDAHMFTNKVVRAATCADPGEGIDTCTLCGESRTVTYPLAEHSYEEGMMVASTCRAEGTQEMVCRVCGAKKWLTLPKSSDHVWSSMGLYWPDKCMICGTTKRDSDTESRSNYSLFPTSTSPQSPDDLFPVIIWDVAAPR